MKPDKQGKYVEQEKPEAFFKGQEKSEEKSMYLKHLEKELGIVIKRNIDKAEENIIRIRAIGKVLDQREFYNRFVDWLKAEHIGGDGW